MQLGKWQLETVCGGRFRLDGGAMFGVVPKPVWERQKPADERNRIAMITNCVLARDGTHTVLIDTGYGGKNSERQRELNDLEDGEPMLVSLSALGVAPEQVDIVVLSHLHFDHAGGATRRDDAGRVVPTFPHARYYINRLEWEDATRDAAELRGSYVKDDFVPLEASGQLELTDGDMEITAGIATQVIGGHTRGHQVIRIESEGQTAVYLADLCPMQAHLRAQWCMAYDVDLLTSRRTKPRVLGLAADEGWLVLFDHDTEIVAARLARDERREFVVAEGFETL